MLVDDLAMALDPVVLAEACGVTPDPWQADVLRCAAQRMILLCARQAGKSSTTALLALHRALYRPNSLILCLAPAERQSIEWFRRCAEAYRALGRPVPAQAENTLALELANGSRVIALPGREGTVRSYSGASLLVLDEAARIDDALFASVAPMLAVSNGRMVMMSSAFGARGFFYDRWANGGPSWARVKVTCEQCPRWTPEAIREYREQYGDWWTQQELYCEFLSAADSVFDSAVVAEAISGQVQPLWGVA